MIIGEKLFALRKKAGLTAKEAATQVGTSESTLLRMEKGKAQPKLATPISNGGLILTAPRYSTSSAPGAGSQPLFLLVAAWDGSSIVLSSRLIVLFLFSYVIPDRFLIYITYC